MGVILREKKLKGGGVSFYLDINHEGRRWYEFLDIRIKGNKRLPENVQNRKLADQALKARGYQLTVEKNHLPNEQNTERDMVSFIREKSKGTPSEINGEYICKKLIAFSGLEELPMNKIDKNFLMSFQEYLKKKDAKGKGLGQGTIYMLVHLFSTFIYKAVENGFMPANPFQKIPRAERMRPKKSTPEYLTAEEIIMLMENSKKVPQQLKLAFLLSCFSGLRWSDCSKLKWSQIVKQTIESKEETIIRVDQKKTKFGYYTPLGEQAIEVINERKKEAETEKHSVYVFPMLYEPNSKENNEKRYAHTMKRWGLKAKLGKRLHFHLGRHTFATLAILAGADLYTVSKLLGHTDIKSTQIYAQVAGRLKVEAVARLPKLAVNISRDSEHRIAS
ncbi:MAG: tyrosine-type recombinase/integrase [Bacteroidia bacterium]